MTKLTKEKLREQLEKALYEFAMDDERSIYGDEYIRLQHRIKVIIRDCIEAVTPEEITAGSIEFGILANYGRDDNADTQKGHNRVLDAIKQNTKELLG